MDNLTLGFGTLSILTAVVIAAFWAIQRGKSGIKGVIKLPGVEANVETSKDAPPAESIQTQFGGVYNSQSSVKNVTSKQTQIGGHGNKQKIS